jgi:hypothetical protein
MNKNLGGRKMNKNLARLVVIGQVMEEKYDPSSHSTADEANAAIGDIEEKLEFLKNLPWLSDKGVETVVHLSGMISILHKEVAKSVEQSRDTFIPTGEENDTY